MDRRSSTFYLCPFLLPRGNVTFFSLVTGNAPSIDWIPFLLVQRNPWINRIGLFSLCNCRTRPKLLPIRHKSFFFFFRVAFCRFSSCLQITFVIVRAVEREGKKIQAERRKQRPSLKYPPLKEDNGKREQFRKRRRKPGK